MMSDYLALFAAAFWIGAAIVYFLTAVKIDPRKIKNGGLLAFMSIVFTFSAGTKPSPDPSMRVDTDRTFIRFRGGRLTSDAVVLEWLYDPMVEDDVLHIDVRAKGSNDEWTPVYRGPTWGQYPKNAGHIGGWSGTIVDAVNKECYIWTEYVPPDIVHTNGVYHLDGVMRAMDDATERKFVTPGITIEKDGEILTPTKGAK